MVSDASSCTGTRYAKRTLETFRERFVSYRGDYEEFEQGLSRSLRPRPLHPLRFYRPGPLTA